MGAQDLLDHANVDAEFVSFVVAQSLQDFVLLPTVGEIVVEFVLLVRL
jgi:hypothetical protein